MPRLVDALFLVEGQNDPGSYFDSYMTIEKEMLGQSEQADAIIDCTEAQKTDGCLDRLMRRKTGPRAGLTLI